MIVKKISSKNKALYGLLLNENAGIIDDLIVYCLEGDFIIVSNCANKKKKTKPRYTKNMQVNSMSLLSTLITRVFGCSGS